MRLLYLGIGWFAGGPVGTGNIGRGLVSLLPDLSRHWRDYGGTQEVRLMGVFCSVYVAHDGFHVQRLKITADETIHHANSFWHACR